MKKILLIITLAFISLQVNAQYYRLRYDSVGIVSKLILNTVATGSTSDSILVKKPNGGVYKISASSLGGGTVTNVSSSNNDIGVTNPTTAPILTLNASASTGANKVMRRDASGDVAITSTLYFQSSSNKVYSDTYDMYFKTGTSGTGDFYWKSNNDATQAMKLDYTGNLTVLGGASFGNTVLGTAGNFSGSVAVADDAYGSGWDGVTTVPTKNAIYDKIESMSGGGSGTVNSGTANRLAYYASTGTAVSELSAITANRVLLSDANGLPVASSVTNTTLGYLDATSSIQTQLNGKLSSIPIATSSVLGGVKEGTNVTIDGSGVISASTQAIGGTYSPTISNISNTSSLSATYAAYTRIGDIVTVDAIINYTTSSGAVTSQVSVTLPFDVCSANQVTGIASVVGTNEAGIVDYNSNTSARVYFPANVVTGSRITHIRFTYTVTD